MDVGQIFGEKWREDHTHFLSLKFSKFFPKLFANIKTWINFFWVLTLHRFHSNSSCLIYELICIIVDQTLSISLIHVIFFVLLCAVHCPKSTIPAGRNYITSVTVIFKTSIHLPFGWSSSSINLLAPRTMEPWLNQQMMLLKQNNELPTTIL